jgi:hypothetical protein
MRIVLALLTIVAVGSFAEGQMRDNHDKQLNCDQAYRDRARNCDVRETTMGPSGKLEIEPGRNGGIMVKGWSQTSVLVRARVEVWAANDADAQRLASQIRVDTPGGVIRATGPDTNGFFPGSQDEGWAVSLEVFAPWSTDLTLDSHNGGITVSDIRGRIEFQAHNGGVHLARLAGDVSGETHNGAIQVELQGNSWEGRQLDLSSYNGAVTLSMPASFSAALETHSSRGSVSSDFPINVTGRIDQSDMHFNIGSGGPLIKISTHNGGIRLRRI